VASPLISVEEALLRVLDGVTALPAEEISIDAAHGRVLAATLASRRTQPPADLSSMDGYAVLATDIAEVPARLRLIGESAAGRPFQGNMKAGEAVRIFTGAVMPPGGDQVVPQENVMRDGDDITINTLPKGKFVRRQGFDFKAGQVMLEFGRRLNARDIGLAAAMDHAKLMATKNRASPSSQPAMSSWNRAAATRRTRSSPLIRSRLRRSFARKAASRSRLAFFPTAWTRLAAQSAPRVISISIFWSRSAALRSAITTWSSPR
jgi:hypothetical protein